MAIAPVLTAQEMEMTQDTDVVGHIEDLLRCADHPGCGAVC